MSAKTVKVQNYTAEQTAELVEAFKPLVGNHDAQKVLAAKFAAKFGKTLKSVVAKVSREGIYTSAPKGVTKTGDKVEKKDETADAIGAVLKMTEAEVTSLAKANKTALVKIFAALANSRPIDGDE